MEIELIIVKYGKYLGGINIERILESLKDNTAAIAVRRLLGIEGLSQELDEGVECDRAKSLMYYYDVELKDLRGLYRELIARGVSPADLGTLRRRISEVKRLKRFYAEIAKRCLND